MDDDTLKILRTIAVMGGAGMIGAGIQSINSKDKRSFLGLMQAISVGGFVGAVTGALLHDTGLSPMMQGGLSAISGVVANQLIIMISSFFSAAASDPKTFIVDTFIVPFINAFASRIRKNPPE